jgi:transposase
VSENLYLTPADFEREKKAIKLINLVIDEHMTIGEAAKEVGISRSTWYRWVKRGRVEHLLWEKYEEVKARNPLCYPRQDEDDHEQSARTHTDVPLVIPWRMH